MWWGEKRYIEIGAWSTSIRIKQCNNSCLCHWLVQQAWNRWNQTIGLPRCENTQHGNKNWYPGGSELECNVIDEKITAKFGKAIAESQPKPGRPSAPGYEKTFSYCNKPGHFAGRCLENTNGDMKCSSFVSMGYVAKICWSIKNVFEYPIGHTQNKVSFSENESSRTCSYEELDSGESHDEADTVNVIWEMKKKKTRILVMKRALNGEPV